MSDELFENSPENSEKSEINVLALAQGSRVHATRSKWKINIWLLRIEIQGNIFIYTHTYFDWNDKSIIRCIFLL